MANTKTLLLVALALCLGVFRPVHAQPAGEGVSNFEVILLVDGKKAGETWINLSNGGTNIEIPSSPVLAALALLVSAEEVKRMSALVSSEGTFTNKVLARQGISLTINGPRRQVMLALAKKAVPPAQTIPKTDSPMVAHHSPKDDSGPWATPPVPALPGHQSDSLDSIFTIEQKKAAAVAASKTAEKGPSVPDAGWDPVAAGASDSAGSRPAMNPRPPGPETQLQSYRLDKTRDELFEEVFKRKAPPLPTSVEVTLLVDGKSYGTLWLNYNKEQKKYTFPVDPVLSALHGLVRADLFDKLTERARRQSRFTVEDLIESGFPTVLNTSVFELSTGVPAQLLGTKIHTLSSQKINPNTVPAISPNKFSAYLNTKIKTQFNYSQYNPSPFDSNGFGFRTVEARNKQPRDAVNVNLDGAVNLMGWVAEGKGNLREKPLNEGVEATRQDFRLVHDWPRRSLRLTAGDLIFPTSGFQSFQKMGGIGLSRDFSLQPHLVAYPVKELEFFLPNKSEVKVYIDGILKTTLELDQGTHDLQGFPFTRGESEVSIEIRDESGQSQTLNFSFIHEPSLLAKGLSAFSYNVGLPSENIGNRNAAPYGAGGVEVLNYLYDADHPAVFLDYKRGITDRFTMEGYTQALDTAGMVGMNGLYALKIGKVSSEFAVSYRQEKEIDWAANLEYIYIPKVTPKASPISWRFKMEYLGPEFYRPFQDTNLLGSVTVASSIQKSAKIANLNMSMSYTSRPEKTDFYNFFLGVSRNWRKGISGNLSLKNTFDRLRHTNTSVSMTATYYFFADQQSVRASQRIENHRPDGNDLQGPPPNWDFTTDLAWDYNSSAPFPKNPSMNATTSLGPTSNDYSGTVEWKGNQGIAQALLRRTEPKRFSVITNYADLSLATSLVYVDGSFALSRPISNSFVLVKGVENEKDCDLLVNSTEVGYEAKGQPWLPGVIPTVNSYYLKQVHVDVIDPPFGSGEERTDFTLYPTYKSGYAIYMGTSATVIALGTLLLAPGVPAEYQTFSATPMDGKSKDPVMGFTNGAGKFQLTRLQPGRYMIEMEAEGKSYNLVLTLPKKTAGIKSVGTLVLKPK